MMEGLQSHNPAIKHCTSSWLITTTQQHYLHCILIPLVSLIKGACPTKMQVQKEEPEKEVELDAAKYCYSSINKEVEEKPFNSPYPSFYFSKLVDTARYNYGLGLFISVILTNPELICTELANSFTTLPDHTLEGSSSRRPSEADSPDDTIVVLPMKSLLEIILSDCMELISSDYPHWLNTSNAEQLSLCEVKVASTSLTVLLLASVANLVTGKYSRNGDVSKGVNIHNPSYVKGLLALCEVQKSTLIALLNLLGPFIESKHTSQQTISNDSSPVEYSLIIHLLKCLNYQLIIESVTAVESPLLSASTATEPLVLQYVPGNPLSTQPMFYLLVQCVFTQASNIDIQIPFLLLIKSSLSYFKNSLETIAPKVVKLLCRNIFSILKEKSTIACKACSSVNYTCSSCLCHIDNELLICYVQTITEIVHYCLLISPFSQSLSQSLHYKILDIFWDISLFKMPDSNLGLQSPQLTPSTSQERRSFGLSWIFGGLFGSAGNGSNHELDHTLAAASTDSHYCGVGTPAGQKVLWLLQYVYNVLTQLWKNIISEKQQTDLAQVHVYST